MWDFMFFLSAFVCVCVCFLTFDHDHVDIYGANGRLWQTLPFLQYVWDFPCGDAVVRLASECHQLPDGHPWRMRGGGRGETKSPRSTENKMSRQIRGARIQMQEGRISGHLLIRNSDGNNKPICHPP